MIASFYILSNSLFIKHNSFREDRNQLSLPEFESQIVKSIPTTMLYKECIMMICSMINLSLYIIKFTTLLLGRSRDRFPVVFFCVVPLTEPCALRSNQPLKVSTRDFSWGQGGRGVWLTTYHRCSAETSRKSGALTYPEPLGPPRPVARDLYFTLHIIKLQVMTTYGREKVWIQVFFTPLHRIQASG